MSKRSLFTTITPLPHNVTREQAIAFLKDHVQMMELNPLIQDHRRIPPPAHAHADQQECAWYEITDTVSYLPGGLATGSITYTCAFQDLKRGMQTHCFAAMGVETRAVWSVGGTMPHEPAEPVELGLVGVPQQGLYLREDVDLRCNVVMTKFIKKTMKKSHATLVRRLQALAAREQQYELDGKTRSRSAEDVAWRPETPPMPGLYATEQQPGWMARPQSTV